MGQQDQNGSVQVNHAKQPKAAEVPICNLSFHQVPQGCREPFLLGGYRPPNYCFRQCLISLFQLHNETMNSWTHIFACSYFLYKAYSCMLDNNADQLSHMPLMLCGLGCAILFGASSVAHTFNPLSLIWRKRLFLMDYAGISFCASGCIVAYQAYLPTRTMYYGSKTIYVIISCFGSWLGVMGCSLSMVNFSSSPLSPVLKSLSFAIVAVVGNISMLKFCITGPNGDIDQDVHTKLCWVFVLYVSLMVASGLVNSSCMPERLAPGRFDCIAHSHQVFHVLIFLAFAVQFEMVDILQENIDKSVMGADEMTRAYLAVGIGWPVYLITALGFFKAVDRTFGPGSVYASIPKPTKAQE